MDRKLATIRTISEMIPIKDRDFIAIAVVDGWQVIVRKEDYKIGEKLIFCEIDSVFPAKPEFAFLEKKKYRIKTMKMAGVISQGICFPMSFLPEGNYEIGDDVTELLGVTKFEKFIQYDPTPKKQHHPLIQFFLKFWIIRWIFLRGKQWRGFPKFISKTDETRLQNIPSILKDKKTKYVIREKVDGQSGTFFLRRMRWWWFWTTYDFGICSTNQRLWNETSTSYWSVAKKYNIKDVLMKLIGNQEFVCIQGECIAPNVQGNKYKVREADLYAFNLIYPDGKVRCCEAEVILKEHGIKWCPLIDSDAVLFDTVNEMTDYATGKSRLHDTLREGLVYRNYEKKISFKVVSPKFLMKHDE